MANAVTNCAITFLVLVVVLFAVLVEIGNRYGKDRVLYHGVDLPGRYPKPRKQKLERTTTGEFPPVIHPVTGTTTNGTTQWIHRNDIVKWIEAIDTDNYDLHPAKSFRQVQYAWEAIHAFGAQRCHEQPCTCYRSAINDLLHYINNEECENRTEKFRIAFQLILRSFPMYIRRQYPRFPCGRFL
jgi:hypothetical protein